MQTKLEKVTECMRPFWRGNCSLLRECEGAMSDKNAEIERLKQQLGLQGDTLVNLSTAVTTEHSVTGVAVRGTG